MAQNLMIDGTVFHGVDSISMTNENGEKVTYIEKTNAGTGVYVAEIGERQFYTVEDALAAAVSGETVMMIADSSEAVNLTIPEGVTLDLQGYALTANNLIGFNGSYINAVTPKSGRLGGRLIIPKGNLILSEQALPKTAPYYLLPFWNDVGYYQFTQIALVDTDSKNVRGLKIDKENETIYFQFTHNASSFVDENLFVDGMDDNELEVVVHLEWTNDKGDAKQEFVYNNEQVGKVAVGVGGQAYDYNYQLKNYTQIGIDDVALETLKVYAMVRTNSGATVFGTNWTLENAKIITGTP